MNDQERHELEQRRIQEHNDYWHEVWLGFSETKETLEKLAEAERVRDESTLELTEIAYAIGGHGTALSQVRSILNENKQLRKELEEIKLLIA